MHDPMQAFESMKHALGVMVRVRSWPSRRMIRRLADENAELSAQLDLQLCDLRPLVEAVDATVAALEETVGAAPRGRLRAVR